MQDQLKKTKKIIIEKSRQKVPKGRGPLYQAFLAIIIFFILTSAYSFFTGVTKKTQEISLSELARAVEVGEVSEIKVVGDKLNITYNDGSEKVALKETSTALSTTLKNYDVSPVALAKVKIAVENNQGFLYYFASII